MAGIIFTAAQHMLFDIGLPTADTFSDVNFALSAFSNHNFGIGSVIMFPVLLNMTFNLYTWKTTDFDTRKEKLFSWILILFNVWPQYQVLKLIFAMIMKRSDRGWKKLQEKVKKRITHIEPFIESVPQFIISLSVYATLFTRDQQFENLRENCTLISCAYTAREWSKNVTEITAVFGKTTLGVSNQIMFPLSVFLSMVSGIKCIMDYLHNSPMNITSKNKLKRIMIFMSKVMYTISCFYSKIVLCVAISWIDARNRIHGGWTLLIIVILFIVIPGMMVFGPLARYLGLKLFSKMLFSNPQLLTLPFITEYAFGPQNGYGYCRCCGCCCGFLCCCWCCCGQKCRFEKGHEIRISRGMSWIKMLYILMYVSPFYAFDVYEVLKTHLSGDDISFDVSFILYLIIVPLGIGCFAITLHLSDTFGTLELLNPDQIDGEDNCST